MMNKEGEDYERYNFSFMNSGTEKLETDNNVKNIEDEGSSFRMTIIFGDTFYCN